MTLAEKELEELAKLLGISREEALNRAVKEGIRELKVRKAIELYVTGKVSVKQAARIAGISLAEWFVIAADKGLLVQIQPDEIEEEAKVLE